MKFLIPDSLRGKCKLFFDGRRHQIQVGEEVASITVTNCRAVTHSAGGYSSSGGYTVGSGGGGHGGAGSVTVTYKCPARSGLRFGRPMRRR